MSFPRYPKYKDSGLEWLGEVPEHWEVFSLKRDLYLLTSGSRGWAENYSNEGDLFIRIANLTRNSIDLDLSDIQRVAVPDGAEGSRTKVQTGDVLFSITAYLGSVAVVPDALETAYVSQHVALARLRQLQLTPRWVGYVALSFVGQTWFETQSYGGTKVQLSLDDVRNLPITVPPCTEQFHITAFLDQETAKIDGLVGEQRRLMGLLKEKRQAVISQAVTKGLTPHAPMKPSGVEWLGDVPKNWEVKPVKFVSRIGNGSTPSRENPDYWKDGHYPWLSSSVVNLDSVIEAEEFVTTQALEECHLPIIVPPAVLVGITGQGRTRGMATTLLIEATINQHVAFLKPVTIKLDVFFLRLVFDMAYPYLRRDSEAGGSTKGAITCEQIGSLKIAIPPVEEQQQIVFLAKCMSSELDILTAEAQRAIDLLQERRTALISAAVTGQIDVRHLPEKQAA